MKVRLDKKIEFKKSQKKHNQILLLTILTIFFITISGFQVSYFFIKDDIVDSKEYRENNQNLSSQDLSVDNILSGIGEPWNLTHWANRTDTDLSVSFEENSDDTIGIPLFSNWNGYQLDINVNDLYDTRNWNNGSFQYGNDDNSYGCPENDTLDIDNSFQNWIFHDLDNPSYNNDMSGNYLDSSATLSVGHDCLELRMNGNLHQTDPDRYYYQEGDKCWWESSFQIPRGRAIDNLLQFQLNPVHLISFNSWELTISINSVRVFTIGIYTLKNMGINTWHDFSIPQGIWTNSSDVFSSGFLNDTTITLEVALEYSANSASYGFEDGENIDYQQILVDNIQLITKAEALASDLTLKVNGTDFQNNGWGSANVSLVNNWIGNDGNVETVFSSNDIGLLGSYSVDLQADLNLFARKDLPESVYETKATSVGTSFSVRNESFVDWISYGRIEVPTRYSENLMKVEYPIDTNITAIYDPQNPAVNVLSQCDNSTLGQLLIPVNDISITPDGYWKFEAISPNYCEDISFYNNKTGSWVQTNEFLSGDYLNITAQVKNSPIVSSYLTNTIAALQIRFPNGTVWSTENQYKFIDSNGIVSFTPIQIPQLPPYYIEGEYEAIVSWNNSYAAFGYNETGLILKKFIVIHESDLIPEQIYYEDVFENSVINIKVSFKDIVTSTPIQNALIYTYNFTHPSTIQYFSEISPGFYLIEFNVSGGVLGNNSLIIYANSTFFVNKVESIKIEVIRETSLVLDNEFLNNIPYGQNFTIQLNYTEKISGVGIDPEILSSDWGGNYHFVRISQGLYNLTCNTSGYAAGNLYSFNIEVDAYKYEVQSKTVKVFITELGSTLEVYVNGTYTSPNDVFTVQIWESLNVTVFYKDIFGNHLSSAGVNISGGTFNYILIEDFLLERYEIILDAEDLGQGIDNLNIFAQLVNYEPQSLPFVVQVIERQTQLRIYLNGVNKTTDPTIELTVGQIVNITIKFYDIDFNHITIANVSLSGDISEILTEDISLNQYTYTLNTSQLQIGVRLLTISAEKINYESQSDMLRIIVNRIKTNITTLSGKTIFEIKSTQRAHLQIVLDDLIYGGTIKDALVTYRWQFGEAILTDGNNDGIYEATLPSAPIGTYIITITAEKSDIYEFQRFEIVVSVIRTQEPFYWFLFILILASVASTALVSYLILYVKVLKYPKAVRKIRKYRKTLSKSKSPSVSIITRENAFNVAFQKEVDKTGKILRGVKPQNGSLLTKKSLEHIPNKLQVQGDMTK